MIARYDGLIDPTASQAELLRHLREGGVDVRLAIIDMATIFGNAAADQALRHLIGELMQCGDFDRAPVTLRYYAIRALSRPPTLGA